MPSKRRAVVERDRGGRAGASDRESAPDFSKKVIERRAAGA